MSTNTERAQRAWTALNQYSPAVEGDSAVSDLLADLMHLVTAQQVAAGRNGFQGWFSFDFLVERAAENFDYELCEDGTAAFPGSWEATL